MDIFDNIKTKFKKTIEKIYNYFRNIFYTTLKIVCPYHFIEWLLPKKYRNRYGYQEGCFLSILKFFLMVYIYVIFLAYIFTLMTFPIRKFNFQMANYYNITYGLLCNIHLVRLEKTYLAYLIRNKLLDQYISIHEKNKQNVYNYIGSFIYVQNDFETLTENLKKNNNKISSNNYEKYKQRYIQELEKILKEYGKRDITIRNYTGRNVDSTRQITPLIPNRIFFYPKLALSYYDVKDIENIETNEKNLKNLKEILYNSDLILNQEKFLNTNDYQNFKRFNKYDSDQNIYSILYSKFLYLYAVKIIFMEKELHPETFCSNTSIFDKYNQGKLEYTDRKRIKVINLLEESCGLTY